MKTEVRVNELSCPFCGNNNYCGVNSSSPCWCFESKIPNALVELLPNKLQHKSCICKNCINSFNTHPAHFKKSIQLKP
ncbi:cysteine-rich CWC family protein [Paraglaciecola algarum]|uniref:cysteine-rich CWC family protein n=1 Tax=Paraglaciecola algarum TaxID=3050085 RepID=UPI0032EA153E